MATTATFSASTNTLTVLGDTLVNAITASRNAAGQILVNNGAVTVVGGAPTIANTAVIQVFGQGGDDALTLVEANGALPAAHLFGGFGNDALTGGSGADQLFGQADNDVLIGMGGNDQLFGGDGNDTLTGGDGDDKLSGEAGDDRMIWSPGDDTDVFEGGSGVDTAEVGGSDSGESFTVTANGTRVRLDRLGADPFFLDIGTTEKLALSMGGGDDSFSATGNLAALIGITVDGGAGNDTILGSNGVDLLIGGDGNDFIDGQQGNDAALLGAGDDVFQWDPGDGSDSVEGQAGFDAMLFNGSAAIESISIFASGGRTQLTRSVANIVMDFDGVEVVKVNAAGGADSIVVNDLSATAVLDVAIDLRAAGVGDAQADTVSVHGGAGGDSIDLVVVGGVASVVGLGALVQAQGVEANDRLVVLGGNGSDIIDASSVAAGAMLVTLDGGGGNDKLFGGGGGDTLLGGAGNDLINGGAGNDTLQGGAGNDSYVLDDAGDAIIENPGEGVDLVTAKISNVLLAENVENLVSAVAGDFVATGNALNNVMTAGGGADTLDGLAGNNVLNGLGGNDTLTGGGGNDVLRGGAGSDTLNGGDGFDTAGYLGAAQGVKAALDGSFAGEGDGSGDIFSGVENLDGSSFNDVLAGDAAANRLAGGAGDDALFGQAGIDTLFGDSGNDTLVGGADADLLNGGAGIDRLDGGLGADRLIADGTADTFAFSNDNSAGADRVFNFQSGVHKLEITAAAFGGAAGAFDFVSAATPVATSGQPTFRYFSGDGRLFFDADGTGPGGSVFVLSLVNAPTLAAGDILLV